MMRIACGFALLLLFAGCEGTGSVSSEQPPIAEGVEGAAIGPNTGLLDGPEARTARGPHMSGERIGFGNRKRLALLVGVGKYPHDARPLTYTRNDATELKTTLEELGEFDKIRLLVDDDATEDDRERPLKLSIDRALRELCQEADDPRDAILFFFSGHGLQDEEGRLYLVPSGGTLEQAEFEEYDLPLQLVYKRLNSSRARQKIVLLDCCRAVSSKGPTVPRPKLPQGNGVVTIFSCVPGSESRESASVQHGLFTYQLLCGVRTGAADRDVNGVVSLQEIKQYVSEQLEDRGQTPWWTFSGDEPERICLAHAGQTPPPPFAAEQGVVNADLVTLPGLDGSWWFDLNPWILPDFRRCEATLQVHVVAKPVDGQLVAPPHPFYGADVTQLQQQLRSVFENSYLSNIADPAESAGIRRVLYDLTLPLRSEEDKERTAEAAKALGDSHLCALVQHRLGIPGAEESYSLAVDQYSGTDVQVVDRALLALCRADFGRWYASEGRYREAAKSFLMARGDLQDARLKAPLLEIECFSGEALALRKMGEPYWHMVDACMEQAFAIAEQHLDSHHPLRAYLHERRAWALMDQWRLSEARNDFAEARDLRQHALDTDLAIDREQVEERVFHNAHGLAMVSRFQGDLGQARDSYESLRDRIEASVNRATPRGRRVFLERLANTTERLADSYLLQPTPEPETALLLLSDATRVARQLQGTTVTSGDPESVIARLLCKATIAATLKQDSTTAKRFMHEFEMLDLSDGQMAELRPFTDTIDALQDQYESTEAAADSRVSRLIAALGSHLQPSSAEDGGDVGGNGLRRETFEFLLFLWARLFDSVELSSDQYDITSIVFRLRPADIKDPALLQYLKPYYDLAIKAELEALDSRDPVDFLSSLRSAMTGRPSYSTPRRSQLHFYFFDNQEDGGYAVLYQDGSLEKFKLDYATSEIQQAVDDQKTLPLPTPLEAHLKEMNQKVDGKWYLAGACPFDIPPNVKFE